LVEYETEAPVGDHTILVPFGEIAIALLPPPEVPDGKVEKSVHVTPPSFE
jgi:hypothetical protein